MLVAFPFEDGQFVRWGASQDWSDAQAALQKCFVDARVNLDRHSVSEVEWPSVGGFAKTKNRLSFFIETCGTKIPLSVTPSRTPFPIISGSADWGWYVVTMSSEGVKEFCESDFEFRAGESNSVRLCDRCVSMKPVELSSLKVYDGVSIDLFDKYVGYEPGEVCRMHGRFYRCRSHVDPGMPFDVGKWDEVGISSIDPDFVLMGDVDIRPGYNIQITEPDDIEMDVEAGFELNAEPGAGLGRVPCDCTRSDVVVSQLFAETGHTRLFNDTCYDVEPFVEEDEKTHEKIGVLQLHVKCTACCTCDMYASIVNDRLVNIANAIRGCKKDLDDDLVLYEDAVARFNRRLEAPTIDDVSMTLTGMPVGKNVGSKLSGSNVSGMMQRCAFTAVVRNSSYSTIIVSVYSLKGSDYVIEATASWADENDDPQSKTTDSARKMIGASFSILPGRSLVIAYITKRDSHVSSVTTGGYTGSVAVGISYKMDSGESGSLGRISKTVEV